MFQKAATAHFTKCDAFQNVPISIKYFGYFCNKNCPQELKQTTLSGPTENLKTIHVNANNERTTYDHKTRFQMSRNHLSLRRVQSFEVKT